MKIGSTECKSWLYLLLVTNLGQIISSLSLPSVKMRIRLLGELYAKAHIISRDLLRTFTSISSFMTHLQVSVLTLNTHPTGNFIPPNYQLLNSFFPFLKVFPDQLHVNNIYSFGNYLSCSAFFNVAMKNHSDLFLCISDTAPAFEKLVQCFVK